MARVGGAEKVMRKLFHRISVVIVCSVTFSIFLSLTDHALGEDFVCRSCYFKQRGAWLNCYDENGWIGAIKNSPSRIGFDEWFRRVLLVSPRCRLHVRDDESWREWFWIYCYPDMTPIEAVQYTVYQDQKSQHRK